MKALELFFSGDFSGGWVEFLGAELRSAHVPLMLTCQ
jgi:hypothetical protein